MIQAIITPGFESWRRKARELLASQTAPDQIVWREVSSAEESLFAAAGGAETNVAATVAAEARLIVPKAFFERAERVALHPDPGRWALLYRVAYRLMHGERGLLAETADPDMRALRRMEEESREALERTARFGRVAAGVERSARAWLPAERTLPALREASKRCEGCDLFQHASQTVFGEGPREARIVFVGEQPGDQEDRQGRPFVGPAGKLLDQALEDAGIRRAVVYITNIVKHFKFIERGKRRLHQTPTSVEAEACKPWLEAEMAAIRPEMIVCLGATAARALLGPAARVTADRGRFREHAWARWITVTIHPSALLRIEEPDRQQEEYAALVRDLRHIREKVGETSHRDTEGREKGRTTPEAS